MGVTFRVLGAVEVARDGVPITLSGKPLAVLACLLVRANSTVSVDALRAALWDGSGPQGKNVLQTHVMRLRRALGADVIRTQGSGYRIDAGPDELDLLRFQELTAQGDSAAARGDDEAAAARFGEAVALWRGPALANVESDVLRREDVAVLDEHRLAAWQRWADAQLRLGATPIAELTRLTGEYPLHEPFWAQLIQALHLAGRTAEALTVYRRASDVLAEELGVDPGAALQRTYQAVLTGESDQPPRQIPRQLAAVVDGFTGRTDELAQLAGLPRAVTETSSAIAVIEGTAGVGKTTLAVRFAHDIASQFAGGHVQLNLHGYGPGDPVPPAAALESALSALGVPGAEVPADLDARSALWRSRTSGRTMLILLDNARDSDQVRPLLPGPGCLVLITSRTQLRGLTAREGAVRISLDRLGDADAVDLLSRAIGAARVDADREAARRFVGRCAHLPLAIRILGEHANAHPALSIAELVDDLDAESDRLSYFDLDDGEDTDLRAIFASSYAALDEDAARLFRLLGLHPGHDIDVLAAAALAGSPVGVTQRLIDRLVGANLLEQHRRGRYEFHDLLREFAASLVRPDDRPALARLLDWYLHSALRASQLLRPGWADQLPVPRGLTLPAFADYRAAMSWYAAERGSIVAAVGAARSRQLHWHACQLVLALRAYFVDVVARDGWIATYEVALESARVIADRRAEGRIMNILGVAHAKYGAVESALSYARSAVDIAEELQLDVDRFDALNNLGIVLSDLGDYHRALPVAEQALALGQKLGVRRETIARNNLADLYLRAGRFGDAAAESQAALALVTEVPDPHGEALALLNLGAAQAGQQDYTASLSNYQASLVLLRATDGLLLQADVMEQLGDLNAATGDHEQSARYFAEALDLLTRLGHRDAERVRGKVAAVRGSAG